MYAKVVLTSAIHFFRLIEPIDLEKAVDLYQKAASVFEVRKCKCNHPFVQNIHNPCELVCDVFRMKIVSDRPQSFWEKPPDFW